LKIAVQVAKQSAVAGWGVSGLPPAFTRVSLENFRKKVSRAGEGSLIPVRVIVLVLLLEAIALLDGQHKAAGIARVARFPPNAAGLVTSDQHEPADLTSDS